MVLRKEGMLDLPGIDDLVLADVEKSSLSSLLFAHLLCVLLCA